MTEHRQIRVLAIASPGGHWVQLRRLRPAWAGCDVAYATSNGGYRHEIAADPASSDCPAPRFHAFPEASRWDKFKLIMQLASVLAIILKERPDVVVSTGASAGYFALRIAKLLRKRTIWVDSIANAGELSLAGEMAGPHADLWLTQWESLAAPPGSPGPVFRGQVL